MTFNSPTTPNPHPIESIASSAQSGLPDAAANSHASLNSVVDIHRALNEVRQMPEFRPPQPGFLDELLKHPLIKDISSKLDHLITQALQSLKQLLSHIKPTGLSHLPENIRDLVTGFIGFILVLMGLYAFYILLGWLLQLRNKRAQKSAAATRQFEETPLIDSHYHYQQAQAAAQRQQFEEGLRQLYMATLCLLDEQKLVPYTVTRSNLEYLNSLEQVQRNAKPGALQSSKQLQSTFSALARQFEAARYGNQSVSASQFEQSQAQYKHIQEMTAHHG